MKILTHLAFLPVLLATALPLVAQAEGTDKISPPKAPFINRLTLPAAWTIAFTRPAEDEMVDVAALKKFVESTMGADSALAKSLSELKEPIAKPMIRTLEVTRTLDFAKEASTFSDKTTQTTYIFNVARITKHVAYDGLIRNRADQSVVTFSPDFAVADFAGFGWLSPENYKGVQTVQGRQCYFFTADIEPEDAQLLAARGLNRGEIEKLPAKAFIDVETKLPVVLQRGQETRIFTIGKPKPADLTLPPDVAAEINAWRAELTSATRAAPPP